MAATAARASGLALTPRLAPAARKLLPASRLPPALATRCWARLLHSRPAGFGTAIRVGNALSDQFFDCDHRLLVERGDDGNRSAGAARAAGPADAVHVVFRLHGEVEIEHVAGRGHVEAAGGDVGGDQDAECRARGIDRGPRCAPIDGMSPCSATDWQAMLRPGDLCSSATSSLCVLAEDDRLLRSSASRRQAPQPSRFSCALVGQVHLELLDVDWVSVCRGLLRSSRVVQAGFGQAADCRGMVAVYITVCR